MKKKTIEGFFNGTEKRVAKNRKLISYEWWEYFKFLNEYGDNLVFIPVITKKEECMKFSSQYSVKLRVTIEEISKRKYPPKRLKEKEDRREKLLKELKGLI